MNRIILFSVFALIFFGGLIALQIFLSKKRNKWYGLMMPALTLLIALIAAVSSVTYRTFYTTAKSYDENGQLVSEIIEPGVDNGDTVVSALISSLMIFFVCNICIKRETGLLFRFRVYFNLRYRTAASRQQARVLSFLSDMR